MTPPEKMRIEKFTGLRAGDFSVTEAEAGHELDYILARPDGRCVFLDDDKKCMIYEWRPLDCRLYPFDIAKLDGRHFWIVHLRYCQWGANQWEKQLAWLEERLLGEIGPHLDAYGSVIGPRWKGGVENWRPLRPVHTSLEPRIDVSPAA